MMWSIYEITGWNHVEALIFFFRLLLSNCLNWKSTCDDHSSLSLELSWIFYRCKENDNEIRGGGGGWVAVLQAGWCFLFAVIFTCVKTGKHFVLTAFFSASLDQKGKINQWKKTFEDPSRWDNLVCGDRILQAMLHIFERGVALQ